MAEKRLSALVFESCCVECDNNKWNATRVVRYYLYDSHFYDYQLQHIHRLGHVLCVAD